MNNSEIKKCGHGHTQISDNSHSQWCEECGAYREMNFGRGEWGNWQFPTRTPEPTKAENGLDEDKLWELLNDAKNGKSQALQMIGEMARRMETSRPVTDLISVQEILKVIFKDVMNTEADKAAEKIFELLSKKRLLAKTNFATPSITKEQLLAILPEKKDEFDFSVKSPRDFNTAIDQMKQRIEELWKA